MKTEFATIVKSEVEIHVVPVDDDIDHEADDTCICGPSEALILENEHFEGSVLMHHSLDGREVSDD